MITSPDDIASQYVTTHYYALLSILSYLRMRSRYLVVSEARAGVVKSVDERQEIPGVGTIWSPQARDVAGHFAADTPRPGHRIFGGEDVQLHPDLGHVTDARLHKPRHLGTSSHA